MPRNGSGRRPVDVLAAAPKPSGRQAIWAAMRARGVFTLGDLARGTDLPRKTIRDYLDCLLAAGVAVIDDACGPAGEAAYSVATEAARRHGAEAPRLRRDGSTVTQGLSTEQMWRTMKRLGGGWTAAELAAAASTEATPVSPVHALDYCRTLLRAGYLRSSGRGRKLRFVFQPHRDTGPLAPQIQRCAQVWDANERRVVWPTPTSAEPAGEPA